MAQQMVAGHHLSNKRYDEAIEGYKLSIKYNDKYAYSYRGLARAYHNKGLFKLAEVNHKKALELEPNFEHGHYELGETYLASGQTQKALEVLEHLKKVNSTFYDDLKIQVDSRSNTQIK
jgi:tetratricopeptide (TPR) repeat protein